jgi:hypothetical protein
VEDRFRLTSILFLVFAILIFWFVRERRRRQAARDPGGRRGLVRQLKRSIARARGQACGASCSGASSTRTPSTP